MMGCYVGRIIRDFEVLLILEVFALLVYAVDREGAYMANFDSLLSEYAKRRQEETGVRVDKIVTNASSLEFIGHPEWRKYKIDCYTQNFRWLEATKDAMVPAFTQSRTFTNRASENITQEFKCTKETSNDYEWTTERGLNIGFSLSFGISAPEYFDASVSFSREKEVQETNETAITKTETYSIKNEVLIPAYRTLKVTYTVVERQIEVPFEVDVFIEGRIAVWYRSKVDGHFLWFPSVTELANEDFRVVDNKLRYKYIGLFRGKHGVTEILRVEEIENGSHGRNESIQNDTNRRSNRIGSNNYRNDGFRTLDPELADIW